MKMRNQRRCIPHLHLAAAAAVASLAASTAHATLLFDNMTSPGSLTATGSTPNTFMGDAYNLPTGTIDLTGFDLFPYNGTTTNFTSLKINFYVWGVVNTGAVSTSAPAFSDELGAYTLTSTGTFTAGYYYPYQSATPGVTPGIYFTTPLVLPTGDTTIGLTFNYQGSTSASAPYTYANVNGLTSIISTGNPATTGSEVFNGYYRNANAEVNGNFTSALRTLGLTNQTIGTRIYGDVATSSLVWNATSGGPYETATNWTPNAVPNSSSDTFFNLSSPSSYVVTVNQADTAKDLYVQSDNVTIDQPSAGSSSLAISGVLGVGLSPTAGTSLTGILNLTNSGNSPQANVSAGSVVVGGNGGTGQLTVASGVSLYSKGIISIANGSSITLSPGAKLYTPGISIAGASNAWTGKLDIGTSALDLAAANNSIGSVTNQVKQGYNGGGWNGTGGVTSNSAATSTTHITAVGAILNDNGHGAAVYGAVGVGLGNFGSTSPALDDVLIRYTYFGDANLDGHVDGSDYSLIDNGYLTGATGWYNGDFNYDGVIDGSDYALIDNSFNTQGSLIITNLALGAAPSSVSSNGGAYFTGSPIATPFNASAPDQVAYPSATPTTEIAFGSAASAAVPEPASLGLIGLASLSLLGRRQRGKR